jgi:bifunctional DNA-binding transcriptional regulator/antitoxin component of YhaV-PrlF toxin-antitoxin module
MSGIQSKVKAQGQIPVPAEARRQLGVGSGSVLVWEWRDDAAAIGMLLNHQQLSVQEADVVARALENFRTRPALGSSACLVFEIELRAIRESPIFRDRRAGPFSP